MSSASRKNERHGARVPRCAVCSEAFAFGADCKETHFPIGPCKTSSPRGKSMGAATPAPATPPRACTPELPRLTVLAPHEPPRVAQLAPVRTRAPSHLEPGNLGS